MNRDFVARAAAPVVEGGMAEQAQYDKARAAFNAALVGRPVANRQLHGGTAPATYADVRSPQRFVSHPAIGQAVQESAVGIETAAPHLPGRAPFTGWDGEADAGSPISWWL